VRTVVTAALHVIADGEHLLAKQTAPHFHSVGSSDPVPGHDNNSLRAIQPWTIRGDDC
jgi:hypothetical protein